jgi:hypothetical protein
MLKTSTILISADATEAVYRSVQEVPEPLRKRLLRSTNSVDSRTILIADQRGRREIERAMRKLSATARNRFANSLLHPDNLRRAQTLTVARAAGILLAAATGLVAWLIVTHRW